MYTVLIQSKKTMDCLQQYYPLLSKSIADDRIGVCQWIESGDTVDTAMPELYDLISHKRSWKAIVVCTVFDEADALYPTDPRNPFDFNENKNRDGLTVVDEEIVDCEAPIIKLTHMLGGLPSPEPKFESTVVESENMLPKVEYYPIDNEKENIQKQAYNSWNDKNMFKGQMPTEIILIKVRKASLSNDALSSVSASWEVHTEADSSEFWKRNLYPHNCRFLVYDMEQRGLMKQQGDLFKLWLAIVLISENSIDPNVLQAHRLYNLNVLLDNSALTSSFQHTINKLNMAKYQIEKSIVEDAIENVNDTVPDYFIKVPVLFSLTKPADIHFKANDYKIVKSLDSNDMQTWDNYSRSAKLQLHSLIQDNDRILNRAILHLREKCTYADNEVVSLSKIQEENMKTSLQDVYNNILKQQELLPLSVADTEEEIESANTKVKSILKERISKKQAIHILFITIFSLLMFIIPELIINKSKIIMLLTLFISNGIISVSIIIALLKQKELFIKAAKNYQMTIQRIINDLSYNAVKFSEFFSDVASHIHGCAYLNIMDQNRKKHDSTYYFKQKHIKSIEIFLSKLSLWSSALHIKVDINSVDAIELLEDSDDEIDYDSLYSFDTGKDFLVPLNHVGIDIHSPFQFVERIEIEREEIYDNDRIN